MDRINPRLPFIALAILAACGSSSTTSVDAPPGTTFDAATSRADARPSTADAPLITNASLVLSGDQTATIAATVIAGLEGTSNESSVAVLVAAPPAGLSTITLSVVVSGALSAKDYAPSDYVMAGATLVAGSKTYFASEASGSFGTLHLTSVDILGQQSGVTVYTVHGSLDATLAPVAGGSNVTMSATF